MTPSAATANARQLIEALREPECYTHPVGCIDVLETHISWVMLTGQYAYKIKKPVNLGFLDFSTLDARRRCCDEELRLNRRLAPELYEAVVPITGTTDHPRIGGNGAAIEYAVKMQEFAQSALASHLLAEAALGAASIDALAESIVAFHARTGVAAHGCPYGTPETVVESARDNFAPLCRLLPDPADQSRLAELRAWTEYEYREHSGLFGNRHVEGYIRECHGDLHLGNIVMLNGQLIPFDCIEFDPALRWIDIMNEVAFLVMDLMDRGRMDFATRFLNTYLETGNGYAGLGVLRFYRVYRALVRAKVHALRASQDGIAVAEHERLIAASRGYVELARHSARHKQPAIIIMHGLSGSGKSVIAQSLADYLGALRLRSDIERKRIGGIAPLARSGSTIANGIYTEDLTRATYHRLLDLARLGINAGYPVIVDATFLKRWQRDIFCRDASARGVPFVIVEVTSPEALLRERIAVRLAAGGDPSEADPAVLTYQIAQNETLTDTEQAATLRVDTANTHVAETQREVNSACASRVANRAAVNSTIHLARR